MGDERFEKLKGETLDMLCSVGGIWMEFDELAAEHLQCDGELDEVALRDVLVDLVLEGSVERNDDDEYRWVQQEGESLAEKVKRLEAENERLRAEQAADRAVVIALVDSLPRCTEVCEAVATRIDHCTGGGGVCDAHRCEAEHAGLIPKHVEHSYAAPLRALQARMATWPSETATEAVPDDVQAGSRGLSFEEAKRRYPEAWSRARATVDAAALWNAEPATDYEPPMHPSAEGVERCAAAWREASIRLSAGPSKVGGSYAEQLGAPAGCVCTWHVQPTFVGAPVVHRGRGMMPCPVHVDADDAPAWHRQPSPRYVGEFGDIDEPSVGDVDGYGRRG